LAVAVNSEGVRGDAVGTNLEGEEAEEDEEEG